jgi:hypothetical protein
MSGDSLRPPAPHTLCSVLQEQRAETATADTRNVCAKRVRTLFLAYRTRITDAGARGGSEREREQERVVPARALLVQLIKKYDNSQIKNPNQILIAPLNLFQ